MNLTLPVYRLCADTKLFSFDDKISDVPILSTPLGSWQQKIVNLAGLELFDIKSINEVKEDQYIIFDENLFFTEKFFFLIINKIKAEDKKNKRFFLKTNDFNKTYIFDHSQDKFEELKFNIYYKNKQSDSVEEVYLDQITFDHYIQIPKQLDRSGQMYHGQCEVFAVTIISPFHLLYTNLALNFNRTIKLQKAIPKWFAKKYIPVGSKFFYKSLKRLNRFGKNCRIHPTAVVEGCVLGDNVQIGANCVVRLSCIGSNSTLEENITLTYSVLGEGCYIANGNIVNLCMCYENVFLIHGPYQFSLFGRSVAVMAVINCDFRLDQKKIRIMSSVGLIDSKQSLLGICYGHESVVGGGNIIAPGRIVPNNIKIPPPNEIIISKFDEFL